MNTIFVTDNREPLSFKKEIFDYHSTVSKRPKFIVINEEFIYVIDIGDLPLRSVISFLPESIQSHFDKNNLSYIDINDLVFKKIDKHKFNNFEKKLLKTNNLENFLQSNNEYYIEHDTFVNQIYLIKYPLFITEVDNSSLSEEEKAFRQQEKINFLQYINTNNSTTLESNQESNQSFLGEALKHFYSTDGYFSTSKFIEYIPPNQRESFFTSFLQRNSFVNLYNSNTKEFFLQFILDTKPFVDNFFSNLSPSKINFFFAKDLLFKHKHIFNENEISFLNKILNNVDPTQKDNELFYTIEKNRIDVVVNISEILSNISEENKFIYEKINYDDILLRFLVKNAADFFAQKFFDETTTVKSETKSLNLILIIESWQSIDGENIKSMVIQIKNFISEKIEYIYLEEFIFGSSDFKDNFQKILHEFHLKSQFKESDEKLVRKKI